VNNNKNQNCIHEEVENIKFMKCLLLFSSESFVLQSAV